jgi:organic radical activating enzyme
MPNSTCRLLSNGYKFNINQDSSISYRPCCFFTESQKLDAPVAQHQKFRQRLNAINSYTSDTCDACNFQEKATLRNTFRNNSLYWVPSDAELGDASYVEIQTDNTCNGGCIICGPGYSSYWQNELKQFAKKPALDPTEQILSFIDIQKTRRILFLGGEPFLSTTDTKILPLIKKPELVHLQYTTNGSIYPSQFHIDLWSKFKSVMINFSLDGIGTKFDYIRYPLKWGQVEKNIIRMIKELPSNVYFKSNHTVNILNLYHYDEFEDWYAQLMPSKRFIEFTFNPCTGTLSPRAVPRKLFDMLMNKYGADSKVIRTITNHSADDQTQLLTYLRDIDTRRGLDWRKIFPEISNCFDQ